VDDQFGTHTVDAIGDHDEIRDAVREQPHPEPRVRHGGRSSASPGANSSHMTEEDTNVRRTAPMLGMWILRTLKGASAQ
jgi:hypothetical protein